MKSSPKPRILLVATQSVHQSNGGMESATQIFEALRHDFDWHIVTNRGSNKVARWGAGGAKVTIVPFDIDAKGLRRATGLGRLALRLGAILLAERPAIVHANDSLSMQIVLWLGPIARGALVLSVRGTQRSGKVYGRHWRAAARQCARIVVLSREMADTIAPRIGASPACLTVIESIVDLDQFHPRREPSTNDHVAIGTIGVFAPNKGQLELIESVAPLLRAGSGRYWLHFYGDFDPTRNAYAHRCAQAVERLGLRDTVKFHGHLDDVAAAYRTLGILAIPSEREGLSRAMIEAMASSVPVVSFAVCSAHEMLAETGAGIVVPGRDFAALALALGELAEGHSRRAAMGKAGREAAERLFERGRARRAWLDLYGELAQSASQGADR